MQELPRITYIICHHNYEQYLSGAIASALGQDYPGQINVCVIDDCSKDFEGVCNIINEALFDGAPDVLHHSDQTTYVAQKDGFKLNAVYLRDNPHGPSYARNRGIEWMWDQTDIFAILDADDENFPQKISVLVEPFIQSDDVGVTYADYYILNMDTNEVSYEYKEPFDMFRLYLECIVHSGSLISKEALAAVKDRNGFYDETMRTCEDYDLWVRITDITDLSIIHVAEPLSLVRDHSNNSTRSVDIETWKRNWERIRTKKRYRTTHDHYRMHSTNP